jgi:hypothetical protein
MNTQLSKALVVVSVILTAIALAVIYPQPAQAQAQVIKQTYDTQVDYTFYAADFPQCLTEDVLMFGTIRTHAYTVIDRKGGLHFKQQEVADCSAVGLETGEKYIIQGPLVLIEHDFEDTTPHEIHFLNLVRLIGQGSLGNLGYQDLYHLVVDGNGVQVLERERVNIQCR